MFLSRNVLKRLAQKSKMTSLITQVPVQMTQNAIGIFSRGAWSTQALDRGDFITAAI
jgi:putative ubiquitin-RnfH superfamily antitoxin RatB of RatAB toxin-antitoxin module